MWFRNELSLLAEESLYCDGAVYQYIAMICHLCRPAFTWQTINILGCSLVNFFHFVVLESCGWCLWARRFVLILSSHYGPGFSKWSLSLRVFHQIMFAPLLFPTCVMCSTQHILLDFITQIILGKEYISQSSLLIYNLRYSLVTYPS
jgi:hypothetical protein